MHRRTSSRQHDIERRFLVREIPGSVAIPPISGKGAAQSYIMLTDEGERVEIKRKGSSFFLVSEHNRDMVPLTLEQFDALWDSKGGDRISSIRYPVSLGKGSAELNVYKGRLEGLVTLTASFGSRKDARRFHPEHWFGNEITHDSEYRNGMLAKKQGPPERKVSMQSELDRGLKTLYDSTVALLGKKDQILVLIETPAASFTQPYGRRDIAAELHEKLKDDSVLVSTEDYSKGGAVDQGLLVEHLKALLAEDGAKKITIVAGPGALNKGLAEVGDITAFVDVGIRERLAAEVISDSGKIDWSPFNTLRHVAGEMERASTGNAQSGKESAQIVIRREFDPREESAGIVTDESRVKYKAEGITHDLLRKLGASRIASLKQENSYFVPLERQLAERGEVIRVRLQDDRTVFTHSGPRIEGRGAAKRHVLRFEVDKAMEPLLLATYKTLQLTNEIMDTAMYQCNGVVFALNTAIGVGNQTGVRNLGDFVEFTVPLPHETTLWEKVSRLVTRMGLNQSKVYTEAYRDM
jgi:adenylate cyclase class IV/CYTH domain-containing protein